MIKKPFFSIIIPTFNRKNLLKIAVNSVLNQSFKDFELIIIDDGSTDKTKEMIKSIKDNRIKYFYQKNKGVSCARNKGIKKAAGKYIAFLDSDDRFTKYKLEIVYETIKKYPKFKIFHTNELWYRNGKILSQKKHHAKPDGDVFDKALKLCCISISTAVIEKNIFEKAGLFDEKLPACEDYDFWLRTACKYQVKLISDCLTIKEAGHIGQQSKKYPAMDIFRIYAIDKLLKKDKLTKKQKESAKNELINKCNIYVKGAKKRKKIKEVEKYQKLIKKYEK